MEIRLSTRELEVFSLVGTTQMSLPEELPLVKLSQEPVLLELLLISSSNTDQLQFTFHHQLGETIRVYSLSPDSKLELTDISIRRLRDLISKV